MADGEFYYCLTHKTVESSEQACKAVDRLGPYRDRQSAETALQTVVDRNETWDNDPLWNDDEDDEDKA